MAAVTRAPLHTRVRAAAPGEGVAIAALWRELWDAHQEWGGYPGTRDPSVYARLASRLDQDARVRSGRPLLGSHVHLVADLGGEPCGQVEGWLERHGIGPSVPLTCEVRSLIVTERARGFGAGRALLDALAKTARALSRSSKCVLAAEVLEPNPAHAFYRRVGFAPVAWNACVDANEGAKAGSDLFVARIAGAQDALAIAKLEEILAGRRRAAGDLRFDRPHGIDAALVAAIAAHLAADAEERGDSSTLVAVDRAGVVRGAASAIVQTLDPPFVPLRRALVGRFALDPVCSPNALVAVLVASGCRFAESRGASRVELTDLSAPGSALHDAALAMGARAWSRVVLESVP
jgi:GNAT superfamily N-acetyltransferase